MICHLKKAETGVFEAKHRSDGLKIFLSGTRKKSKYESFQRTDAIRVNVVNKCNKLCVRTSSSLYKLLRGENVWLESVGFWSAVSSMGSLMIVVSAAILFSQTMVLSSVNVQEVYIHCGSKDTADSDDQSLIDYLQRDMIRHTPQNSFNHYDQIELGLLNVYGHTVCRTPISSTNCISCLQVANSHRLAKCWYVKGFEIALVDCFMRIEEYDFKYDPTLVLA